MEIKFSKPSRECTATGRPFQHEESIVSLVRLRDGALIREDYARDAYEERQAAGAVAVWSCVYYDPQVLQQEPEESYSPLRRIFYDASAEDSRHHTAVAFLAAQLLKRQKVFRLVKQSDGEENVHITLYTDRVNERLVEVPDPGLTYAEMDAARETLAQQLAALEAGEAAQADEAEGKSAVAAAAEGNDSHGAP